jgi:hypothetical protein
LAAQTAKREEASSVGSGREDSGRDHQQRARGGLLARGRRFGPCHRRIHEIRWETVLVVRVERAFSSVKLGWRQKRQRFGASRTVPGQKTFGMAKGLPSRSGRMRREPHRSPPCTEGNLVKHVGSRAKNGCSFLTCEIANIGRTNLCPPPCGAERHTRIQWWSSSMGAEALFDEGSRR